MGRIAAGLDLVLLLTCLSTVSSSAEPLTATREAWVQESLAGPLGGVDDIVFAVRKLGDDGHWYANFSYYAEGPSRVAYKDGAKLVKFNIRSGNSTILLQDPEGGIRDPQVHYDGQRIVFSYRKGGTCHYNLYEIGVDGSGLRQLTSGLYDDIEPTYLPDGGIMFVSTRCKRWVNCWLTQVGDLHRCDADGSNIRQVSSNNEHDNTPWPLPDGRVLYQRWEYVDRSQVHYHHLWTMNPDGSSQMVYYGNQQPGVVMIDAKPIPGSDKIVSIFSPGHGQREHNGYVTLLTSKLGPDAPEAARHLNESSDFRDPYPLSEECFLIARGSEILLMNGAGETAPVYTVSEEDQQAGLECHEPRPVHARQRELVLTAKAKPEESTGRLFLADIYEGRNMAGVARGDIKKLLVLESLPKPINYTGGMEPLSYGGTFTLERVLGTAPVEPDGSAYVEVPALRSLILVALDDKDLAIKRMQSFLAVQPGEVLSCVGCHEHRNRTIMPAAHLDAMAHPPSPITPIAGVPDVFDFPRDIQPILDAHCVRCHGYEANEDGGPMAGHVILSGDHGPLYSHSYFTLSARREFSDGRNQALSNYAPRTFGSAASRLLQKLSGSHHDVIATPREQTIVRLWIDSGAPYPGTYAGLGSGMIGGYAENIIDRSDTQWSSMQGAQAVLRERCGECHQGPLELPDSPSDNMDMPPWEIKYDDPRLRFSRHILYNLTRPEQSLQLLAPLSKEAGGLGICEGDGAHAVFASARDHDYVTLLAAIRDTKQQLDTIKRFDMPGFRPPSPYIREMKRYGILPEDFAEDTPVDPYALDRAYWESLWWPPAPATVASVDR